MRGIDNREELYIEQRVIVIAQLRHAAAIDCCYGNTHTQTANGMHIIIIILQDLNTLP